MKCVRCQACNSAILPRRCRCQACNSAIHPREVCRCQACNSAILPRRCRCQACNSAILLPRKCVRCQACNSAILRDRPAILQFFSREGVGARLAILQFSREVCRCQARNSAILGTLKLAVRIAILQAWHQRRPKSNTYAKSQRRKTST